MNKTIKYSLNDTVRVDVFLVKKFGQFSRSFIKDKIINQKILVNDNPIKPNYKLKKGDRIKLFFDIEPKPSLPKGEDIPLEIIFENKDVIVINKPVGMTVHPAAGNLSGTLVNALINYYPKITDVVYDKNAEISKIRPGLVHRLDKDTSGLIVVAKNIRTMRSLSKQIKNHTVEKKYQAICFGWPKTESGEIISYMGRNPKDRKTMADIGQDKGKKAISNYKVLQHMINNHKERISLIEFDIKTGRTHQIRFQAKQIGIPILGDQTYKTKESSLLQNKLNLKHQLLYACSLKFCLPRETIYSEYQSPKPEIFTSIMRKFKTL